MIKLIGNNLVVIKRALGSSLMKGISDLFLVEGLNMGPLMIVMIVDEQN